MANITFSEGSGINDSIFGKSQEPIKMVIEQRAEAFESQSQLNALFNFEKSKNWAEKVTSMTAMEGPKPVGENGAYPIDGFQEGYAKVLEHITWKNSFSISREMIDDAKIADMKKQPASFTTAYYRTRELFGASLIGEAMRGSAQYKFRGWQVDATTADGQRLFATAHPSKVKRNQNQSNLFADEFSKDALSYMEAYMQKFRGDNGELLDLRPDTIIIGNDPQLKNAVFEVIGADRNPVNATNAFNYQYGRWNVIVWPYLDDYIAADTHPWLLFDSGYNQEYGGAMWYDRVNLEIKSEIADNDANKWKMYARFIAGFNDWRAFAIGGVTGGTQLVN